VKNATTSQLSGFTLAALWFGAAVSLAEIWSGGLLSPLGPQWGQLANVAGHLIGGAIFLGAAWISARERKNAMQVLARPFGVIGPCFFGILNIIQLVGWTAVMLITGALAFGENHLWGKLLLGVLLFIWVVAGWKGVKTLNLIAVILLLILTVGITFLLFGKTNVPQAPSVPLSFPLGMELVLAMPLSWLPLIGDYTSRAKGAKSGSWAATLGYAAGSFWMFSTGLIGVLKTGQSDPTQLMVAAGLGFVGIVVILLSTVTTAFLDAYSAGVSATALHPRIQARPAALIFTVMGIFLALVFPMDQYVNFLYVIGAIFCPLYAVVLSDYFLFPKASEQGMIRVVAFLAWAAGTALYYWLLNLNFSLGMALPSALASALIYFLVRKGVETWQRPL